MGVGHVGAGSGSCGGGERELSVTAVGVAEGEKKMTARMAVQFAAVILMIALSGSAFAGDVEDGAAAYERGDFTTAFSKFMSAAEQGNAYAQHNVAVMYEEGEGVPRNYEQAVYWITKSAEQGFAPAQLRLGLTYEYGKGVPRSTVQAYVWFSLAAAQGNEDARLKLNLIEQLLSRDQVDEAQQLSREWKPR